MSIKKISKQALYLLVAATLFTTACQKDPVEKPIDPEQTKKLMKVSEDANNYSAFEYNADGNLSKMTIASDEDGDPEILAITYTYNDQKKPTGLNFAGIANFKYIYSGNKITKVELYSNNILGAYDVLHYTGEMISKVEKYFRGANATFELDSKSEYSYYDNGNIKETKNYIMNDDAQWEHTDTQQYLQYDTKKSPYKSIGEVNIGLFLEFLSVNNITRWKRINPNGNITTETEISYTYNTEGYPLTSTVKSTVDGVVTNSSSTFSYQ